MSVIVFLLNFGSDGVWTQIFWPWETFHYQPSLVVFFATFLSCFLCCYTLIMINECRLSYPLILFCFFFFSPEFWKIQEKPYLPRKSWQVVGQRNWYIWFTGDIFSCNGLDKYTNWHWPKFLRSYWLIHDSTNGCVQFNLFLSSFWRSLILSNLILGLPLFLEF